MFDVIRVSTENSPPRETKMQTFGNGQLNMQQQMQDNDRDYILASQNRLSLEQPYAGPQGNYLGHAPRSGAKGEDKILDYG